MAVKSRVDLGFINSCDPRFLHSRYFPSKVGGKPAWLSLKPVPPTDCGKCHKQMAFLMQVYSPREKPEEDAFHRTLFLFVCQNYECCSANDSTNFLVLRSQLPRKNDFFSSDPPPDDPSEEEAAKYSAEDPVVREAVFPEFELEMEEEDCSSDDSDNEEEEEKAGPQQQQQSVDIPPSDLTDDDVNDLELMASKETDDQKQFLAFKKRVELNEDQVLRYCKGGEPLWVSVNHQAKEADIPPCSCGAPRQFEFQVMPQLLNHLKVDQKDKSSLDWGTLSVYTCAKSCATGNNYVPEFLWKQDFTT
ncbi:hypothetical protein ACOMHN_026013 [Nucella lapillus]